MCQLLLVRRAPATGWVLTKFCFCKNNKRIIITGRPNGLHLPTLLPTLLNQLLQTDATMTNLCQLPPLHASRQDADNARPSIDTFEREPGRQPEVLLLPLHLNGIQHLCAGH